MKQTDPEQFERRRLRLSKQLTTEMHRLQLRWQQLLVRKARVFAARPR